MLMRTKLLALALAAVGALDAFPVAVFPVGNYTIVGSVLDWGGGLLDENYFNANDCVTVMAVATNGTVLASTKVASEASTVPALDNLFCNYRLDVPISSGRVEGMAVRGEPLDIVIVTDTATYMTVSNGAATVTGAGDIVRLDFRLADDADGDGVADEYVAELEPYMEAWGYKWNLYADWDGDGKTNFEEYLAGTDPTDENDRLVLTFPASHKGKGLLPAAGDRYIWPVTFEAKEDRLYYAVGAGDLPPDEAGVVREPDWTNETFTVNSENLIHTIYRSPENETTTFWLLPVGDRHLWRVLIKGADDTIKIKKLGE